MTIPYPRNLGVQNLNRNVAIVPSSNSGGRGANIGSLAERNPAQRGMTYTSKAPKNMNTIVRTLGSRR